MRLLIILMTFYVTTANADMYKCKDANGKTSYSQKPCQMGSKAEVFEIKEASEATIAERERQIKVVADKEAEQLKAAAKDTTTQMKNPSKNRVGLKPNK